MSDTELTPGLEDNPYEKAFPDDYERLREDIEKMLESDGSRPGKAEEILRHAQIFLDYAKNTEQVVE